MFCAIKNVWVSRFENVNFIARKNKTETRFCKVALVLKNLGFEVLSNFQQVAWYRHQDIRALEQWRSFGPPLQNKLDRELENAIVTRYA